MLSSLSDQSEFHQDDRRTLDLAVLELLGLSSRAERERVLDELYEHLASYFENVRAKEEEAIDNKRRTASAATLTADQIANDVMEEIARDHPTLLRNYADLSAGTDGDGVHIPSNGDPIIVNDLVTQGVQFSEGRTGQIVPARSLPQAELIAAIAEVGPRGRSLFVSREEERARPLIDRLRVIARERSRVALELIEYRTSDPSLIDAARLRVMNRLVAGVPRPRRQTALSASE